MPYDNIKSHKKTGFHPLFRGYIFQKTTVGGQIPPSRFRVKKIYMLLELKVPWAMSAISETYNRTHNVLELHDVFTNLSFTVSEMERDYY